MHFFGDKGFEPTILLKIACAYKTIRFYESGIFRQSLWDKDFFFCHFRAVSIGFGLATCCGMAHFTHALFSRTRPKKAKSQKLLLMFRAVILHKTPGWNFTPCLACHSWVASSIFLGLVVCCGIAFSPVLLYCKRPRQPS